MGVKYIEKISGAFAQFYYEPKTALKNKVLKKKKSVFLPYVSKVIL